MKSMKVKRYLQGLLLIICLLVTSCAQIIAVNADEQDVSLEITLEDESTPMEGVIFSMYQITDGITAPDGQSLKFMPDFEDCGYKTDVKTAKELVALSRRLKIWIDEKDIQPTYTLATDVTGRCSISSIPFGMYLIVPSSYDDYGPVVMSLVFLPGRDANGDLIYQNRIIPKHSIPEEDEPDGPTNPHESNSTTPEETSPEETTPDESTSSEEETTPSEPTSPAESTTPSESRTPEEESNPYQPTTPAAPTTPSQTTPTTAPQTTAAHHTAAHHTARITKTYPRYRRSNRTHRYDDGHSRRRTNGNRNCADSKKRTEKIKFVTKVKYRFFIGRPL